MGLSTKYLHAAEFRLSSETHEAIMLAASTWRLPGLSAKDKILIKRNRIDSVTTIHNASTFTKQSEIRS